MSVQEARQEEHLSARHHLATRLEALRAMADEAQRCVREGGRLGDAWQRLLDTRVTAVREAIVIAQASRP